MEEIERIAVQVRRCKKCRLAKGRKHAVPGEGPCPAKIMIIGQAPGRNEDASGRPFVGMAGRFLDRLLEKNGIDRKKAFITSVVKCFPPKNRIPKNDEIKACNPYLMEQIRLVRPKIVVLLGNVAIRIVLRTQNPRLETNHGKHVERSGIVYLPTYHPAAGMMFPNIKKRMESDFSQVKRQMPWHHTINL